MAAKILNVQTLLWIALGLALAGSLKHLAHIFASIDGNTFMGWVQAVAIDTGLFALAYSIRQRKATHRAVLPLWLGVALFSGISIYGNYTYGMIATGAELPTWIVSTKPIVLAASLPVLVLYLAELVSDNRQWQIVEAAQPAPVQPAPVQPKPQQPKPVQPKPAQPPADPDKAHRLNELQKLLADDPNIPQTKLAERLGVSRTTVRNYLAELQVAG